MTLTSVEVAIRILVVWSMFLMSGPSAIVTQASNDQPINEVTKLTLPLQQAKPVADFVGSPTIGVAPLRVNFVNSSTDALSYQWLYGDGTVSSTSEITHSHVYTQPGSYTVVLQATNSLTMTDTLTRTAYVTVSKPTPTALFDGIPTNGNTPLTVTFINSSTNASSYLWDFGDGFSSKDANPAHTYTKSGVYTITLQASDGVITDTLVQPAYVEVTPPVSPLADFSASPLTGPTPLSVTFLNQSTNASSYLWDFGDGFSSKDANPVHTYASSGVYTITLQASDGVITDTLVQPAYVEVTAPVSPLADFNASPLTGPTPLSVTFLNQSTNASQYLWDFGDGARSIEANPIHTYASSGVYTITLQASDGVITDTLVQPAYVEVTAAPSPVADFSASPLTGPTPLQVTFLNQSNQATSYLWDFGDGTTSKEISPTHTYTQAGAYTVVLKASDGTTTDTLTQTNYVTPFSLSNPRASFTAKPQRGEVPLVVTFVNSSSNATNFVWDFGDGSSRVMTSPVHTYSIPGRYTVTLQAGNGSVTDTLSLSHYITATDLLIAAFDPLPPTAQIGEVISFQNYSTGASSYLWDFGDGISSTETSPSHIYGTAGVYTVTLTAFNDNFRASTTAVLNIQEASAAVVAGPPAKIQIGLKEVTDTKQAFRQGRRWVAVRVVDADGVAVADGTEVRLSISTGDLDETIVQTENGVARTRFKVPRGQPFTITAQAGAAQNTFVWSENDLTRPRQLSQRANDKRYGDEVAATIRARNALEADGSDIVAENQTRRITFNQNGFSYHLKTQDRDLRGEDPTVVADQRLTVGFQLTNFRIGRNSLLRGPIERVTGDNWITYQDREGQWQVTYEVAEASVEQYFVLGKGIPIEGDVVIEGRFQTRLQPQFISNEEGIRFVSRSNRGEEAEQLGYGPALVEDASGRRLIGEMQLRGRRLRITIPEAWLARADFPVVIDPLIGPAEMINDLPGDANDPVTASDGTDFLTVWEWNGDIYGQLVDDTGALSGTLITISQADGVQHEPAVSYNPQTDEYLVIWDDNRYGFTYSGLQGQRLNSSGQLVGSEIEIVPPTEDLDNPDVAVSEVGDYLVVWDDISGTTGSDIYGQMVRSSGILSGTKMTITAVSNVQQQPAVAYDNNEDVFLVVWADRRSGDYDIYGQRLDASGQLLGSNQSLASTAQSDWYPDVTANNLGQFLVVFEEEFSSSNDDARAIRVDASTGLAQGSLIGLDQGSDRERSVAVTSLDGEYITVWEDQTLIQGRPVYSDGLTGDTVSVSLTTTGNRYFPEIAASDTQALSLWTDTSQAGSKGSSLITGRRVTTSGSTNGDEIFISPYFNEKERTALTYNPDSQEFLLAWQQAAQAPEADIFVQRVDGQGQAIAPPLNLTNLVTAQERPAVAAGQSGYLVTWRDARNEGSTGLDIYGQRLNLSGGMTGDLITITTAASDQSNPAVAYNSVRDEYLVVWDDDQGSDLDIYGQIVEADGDLGTSFSWSVSDRQAYPDVAYNPDDDTYLVVWEDRRPAAAAYDIYGQVISGSGSLLGSNFGLTSVSKSQFDPVVTYNSTAQRFMVGWWDYRDSNWDIYGQAISGTGTLAGSNFAISTPSSGSNNDQEYPDIIAGPADEFLVVWQDRRNDSDRDIYAQRIDAAGNLLDETDPTVNIVIESSTSDYTERPVVAYSPADGVYLIGWNNQDDGSIYTQRYVGQTPDLPGASFTAVPARGVVPLTLTVTDTSTGTIASLALNFDDGIAAIEGNPGDVVSHTYIATGTFQVVLTTTNPGGSTTVSQLVTVTEQITPHLVTDFENVELGVDPTFWQDQLWNTTSRDDFEIVWSGDSRTLGTDYTGSPTIYSTYAIPGWSVWQNYEYSGRLKMTDANSGIGAAFYSRYPDGEEKAYYLRRYADTTQTEQFHLAGVGAGAGLTGDVDTDVTPVPNQWYQFRIQVMSLAGRVAVRAKVWAAGGPEPTDWQATAESTDAARLTAGAVAARTSGAGSKYFDDLSVTPLTTQAEFTSDLQTGFKPFTPVFTSTSPGWVLTYTWSFGDGTPLQVTTNPTTTHTYTQSGVYTTSLTVDDGVTTNALTKTNYITVNNPLAAGFSAFPLQADVPLLVLFLDNSTGASTYFWQFGDGITSTLPSPTHTYTIPGVYTVTQTVGDGVETDILTKTNYITVTEALSANFSATPVAGGVPLTTTFTNQSTGADSYLWVYGDGITSTTSATTHIYTYTQVGVYTITLTASDAGGSDTLTRTHYITVANVAIADFSATPLVGTPPLSVTFVNTSTGADSYRWAYGDGVVSTTTAITHTYLYTRPGIFTVTLTAGNGIVTDTLSRPGYITLTQPITRDWRQITSTVSPSVVADHALAYDPDRDVTILYGGNATGWPYEDQTWEFDGTNWLTVTTTTTPTVRYGVSMAYLPNEGVILFGGSDTADMAFNQTWVYTASDWSLVPVVGTVPPSRTYASLVSNPISQTLYLFGGQNSREGTLYNDLWAYENGSWTEVSVSSAKPLSRTLTAFTYDALNQQLLLFGGQASDGTALADLWAFDLVTQTWTELDPGGGGGDPPPRFTHSLTYDPLLEQTILVGGTPDGGDTLLSDTWHYDSANGWSEATPTTTLPGRAYQQAVYTPAGLIFFSNGEVWRYE